jgi:hypothetical protein
MKEKTDIQKLIDLIEASGFHVFRAEEEIRTEASNDYRGKTGTILLRIVPQAKEVKS